MTMKLAIACTAALLAATPALAEDAAELARRDAVLKSTIVYLASYPTEAKARAGWKTLAKAAPQLRGQDPRVMPVDLGKKGKWVRLYALAADEAERNALCKRLARLVDECGARNRE